MEQFRLFAHGEAFDVDAFLAATVLRPDYVWRRGDQKRHSCIAAPHPTSGVEIVLSNAAAISLPEQEDMAIEYLTAHRDELRALAAFPGVETFILALQYHIELGEDSIGFCVGPSELLMWHALDIGVRPTYYVWCDRRSDQQDVYN